MSYFIKFGLITLVEFLVLILVLAFIEIKLKDHADGPGYIILALAGYYLVITSLIKISDIL